MHLCIISAWSRYQTFFLRSNPYACKLTPIVHAHQRSTVDFSRSALFGGEKVHRKMRRPCPCRLQNALTFSEYLRSVPGQKPRRAYEAYIGVQAQRTHRICFVQRQHPGRVHQRILHDSRGPFHEAARVCQFRHGNQ